MSTIWQQSNHKALMSLNVLIMNFRDDKPATQNEQ